MIAGYDLLDLPGYTSIPSVGSSTFLDATVSMLPEGLNPDLVRSKYYTWHAANRFCTVENPGGNTRLSKSQKPKQFCHYQFDILKSL